MAASAMFENGLTADILTSLRASADSWMGSVDGQSLARLSIKVDPSPRAGRDGTSSEGYWISGDRMSGSLSVESLQPLTITRARISLEGICMSSSRKSSSNTDMHCRNLPHPYQGT